MQLKQFGYPILTEYPVGKDHHLSFSSCLHVSHAHLILIHRNNLSRIIISHLKSVIRGLTSQQQMLFIIFT